MKKYDLFSIRRSSIIHPIKRVPSHFAWTQLRQLPFQVVAVVVFRSPNITMCSVTAGSVWLQQPRYEAAEADFQCYLNKSRSPTTQGEENAGAQTVGLEQRVSLLEKENRELKKAVEELRKVTSALNLQLRSGAKANVEVDKNSNNIVTKMDVEGTEHSEEEEDDDDDDDIDLFNSDEEEDEAKVREREERIKAYQLKKSKKPALIAKSSVTLDVKPWDDETDMKKVEECVRTIEMDGLLWGASKLSPLAYGIMKLTILCVVEDEKVSVDDLQEKICEFEDYVQSVDIAAFNKI
ncbi:translation elongation factor 1 delta a (guanine nucleotide exchange) isoform X5 [Octopus vulgaris]|uniref:Translation elongation factor 1 delta a (Guanine nucleotide exchange ) isoform X5 n=1 Tax=Octopus vulgaris TaxID=6645 RepID=A0AA36ANW5_OCTVU|nr:translation elongation factor 1 delta a (guanine nucleotide exchange) isoform X5 [Octopus vulgaris]